MIFFMCVFYFLPVSRVSQHAVDWSITCTHILTYGPLTVLMGEGKSHNQENNSGWSMERPSRCEVTALQTDPVRRPYMLFLNDHMMESHAKSKSIFQMRSLTLGNRCNFLFHCEPCQNVTLLLAVTFLFCLY